MTVKMTSTKLCGLVYVMTLVNVHSVPLDFTTSRYNEETLKLHNTNLSYISNSPTNQASRIFDMNIFTPFVDRHTIMSNRRSKAPKNSGFYSEESMRNIRHTNFQDIDNQTESIIESRKFMNKTNSKLYTNFVRNSVNTKKFPNKMLKIHPTKTSYVDRRITKNSAQLYGNFIKNKLRDTQTLRPISSNQSNNAISYLTNSFTITKKPSIIKNMKINKDDRNIFKIKLQPSSNNSTRKILTITRKPIVLRLTKIPAIEKIVNVTGRPTLKSTRTPGWISKIKSTTYSPSTSTRKVQSTAAHHHGWPNNNNGAPWKSTMKKRPMNSTTHKTKKKPGGGKYVPRPGYSPNIEEIKQNWYESGVPYPNPMPEISSNSPVPPVDGLYFPSPSIENIPVADDPESIQVDAIDPNNLSNAISTFNLDMRPSNTDFKDSYVGGLGDGCPTVHISSSVLSPQQRQDCSDLNLVINSHFHQNSGSDRTPTVDTYQAANPEDGIPVDAAEDPVQDPAEGGQIDDGLAQADSGIPQADSVGSLGSGGTGGNGASGGSGGDGGDGDDGGGLKLPDLKGMLDVLDWFGNKLGWIFDIFKNPYLYIVPATLFFLVGFILVLALFPWWVPILFLFVGLKAKYKPNIMHHKHVHKAVHHPDGWFWNQNTKTWENIQDYLHRKRIDNTNLSYIPQAIDHFDKKYRFDNSIRKSSKKIR